VDGAVENYERADDDFCARSRNSVCMHACACERVKRIPSAYLVCAFTRAHAHKRAHTHSYIHLHTQTHAHAHAHEHTQKRGVPQFCGSAHGDLTHACMHARTGFNTGHSEQNCLEKWLHAAILGRYCFYKVA